MPSSNEVVQVVQIQLDTSQAVQSAGELEQGIHQVGEEFIFTNEQVLALTNRYGAMATTAEATNQTMIAGSTASAAAVVTETEANEGLNISLAKTRILVTDIGRELTGKGLSIRNLISTIGLLGPQVLIAAAAVGTLGYAFYEWTTKIRTTEDAMNSLTDAVVKGIGSQIGEVKILVSTIEDVTTSEKDRKQAIQDLIDQHPAQFRNLKDTSDILKTLKKDEDNYTTAIIANSYIKAASSKIDELTAKNLEIQIESNKSLADWQRQVAQDKADNSKAGIDLDTKSIQVEKEQAQQKIDANNKIISSYLDVAKAQRQTLEGAGGTDEEEKKREERARKAAEEEKKREAAAERAYEKALKLEDEKEKREAMAEANHQIRQAKIVQDEKDQDDKLLKLEEDYLIKSTKIEGDKTKAELQEESDRYIKIKTLATVTISDKTKLDSTLAQIETQHQANIAAIVKKGLEDQGKIELKAITDREKLILNDHTKGLAARKKAINEELTDLQKLHAAKKISDEQYTKSVEDNSNQQIAIKKQQQQIEQQIASDAANLFSTLSDLAGKNTQAGKDLAIVSATIKSIQTGINIFEGFTSEIPGPAGLALGAAAAAATLVSLVGEIKKIEDTNVPGQGGSGGGGSSSLGSISASAGSSSSVGLPNAPSTAQTMTLSQSTINQLNAPVQQPIRVTVGVSEITQTQNRLNNYSNHSKL